MPGCAADLASWTKLAAAAIARPLDADRRPLALMLEADALTKAFGGNRAVDGVSLHGRARHASPG